MHSLSLVFTLCRCFGSPLTPAPDAPLSDKRHHVTFRTWNPLRRFFPLLPAWWAHIKNQRILNDYITGIVRARWDVIQKERSLASGVSSAKGAGGSGGGNASPTAGGRKRDILDKVLDSLEPGEWGTATVMQVSKVYHQLAPPALKYTHRCKEIRHHI